MGWFSRTPAAPPLPPAELPRDLALQEVRSRLDLLEDDLAELHKRYRRLLGSVTKSEALAREAGAAAPGDGAAAVHARRPPGLVGALTPAARAQLMGG